LNRLRIILLLVTIASFIAGYILVSGKTVDERAYLKELVPNLNFSEKQGAPSHYESGTGIVAFNTYDIVPDIKGYAGPVKTLVALNKKGEIRGIKIIEHKETRNYVHYMLGTEYLRQFIGKNVNDPFEPGKDIDAISRATESVEALAKTVRKSSRIIAARVHGLKVTGKEREIKTGKGWILYLALFFAALISYFITRSSRHLLKLRDGFLLAAIIVIGFYLASPFSILHVFNLILSRLSSSVLWYAVVISTILSIAIAGRFYCGWLCPFGALAEFLGRLPSVKWEISTETDDMWRRLKYMLLCLIVIVVLVSRRTEHGNFETYVTLFSFHGNALNWTFAGLMLVINIKVERFWCRYLCPVAAFTGLLSRKAHGYVSKRDCPMRNRPDPLISECIRCNRCYNEPR
jgi:hypothetical protein